MGAPHQRLCPLAFRSNVRTEDIGLRALALSLGVLTMYTAWLRYLGIRLRVATLPVVPPFLLSHDVTAS
ncbi:hypothetical protein A0130_13105 [Leifsonia xyli]|nr:hypothetical protein A0130_13105 [Leifsonia xyli]